MSALYFDDFFRVDLKNFILLFQIYFLENEKQVYIGYLLNHTLDTRIYLAAQYQEALFKRLL